MTNHIGFDWDNATVSVRVPTYHTSSVTWSEFELPLGTLARLLLTSVPAEWFVEPPTGGEDLPLFIKVEDPA